MSIWNSLQGGRGGGRGGSSSLDELIRNQRRYPQSQHQSYPPQGNNQGLQSNYPPPSADSFASHRPSGTSYFPRNNPEKKNQGETNPNALTPPRGTVDEGVPLEYSPPSSSSTWRGSQASPFQSMTKPLSNPSDPSSGSASHFFESSGWAGPDARGRGRGPPGRGAPSQKFSCRVCKLSFDTRQLLNAHLTEQQHFHTQGADPSQMFPEPNKRTFSCRVCNAVFESNPLLYAHLKAEGHFNTSANGGVADSAGDGEPVNIVAEYPPAPPSRPGKETFQNPPEPVKDPRKAPPNTVEGSKPARVEPPPFQPKRQPPAPPAPSSAPPPVVLVRPSLPPPAQKVTEPEISSPAPLSVPKMPLFSKGPKVVDLSGKKTNDEDESAPVFRSSKFPPKGAPAQSIVESVKREARATPLLEQEDDGDDVHSDGQVVGTCTEMCPEEEILIRLRSNEIHLFEQPGEEMAGLKSDQLVEVLRSTMVKQYQRSAADHKLAIPHLVRTPWS
jgi:hypothetical protein